MLATGPLTGLSKFETQTPLTFQLQSSASFYRAEHMRLAYVFIPSWHLVPLPPTFLLTSTRHPQSLYSLAFVS
ncbi:hypothetical protein M3J09_000451 [Ascochyta lentis]